MPDPTDAADFGLVEAAAAVRAGSGTPLELLDASLARIAQWEPSVKALIGGPLESAEHTARLRTEQLVDGGPVGPLHGVPIIVKDLIDMEGIATTAASRILEGNIALHDAPVVERLRKAGAVLVAKANTHEFAYGAVTPPTRNPWDLSRMPGGSSGGSAAAVATGMACGALGTDTAASIREPAALCGLIGYKPTYGRVPLRGVVPLAWSLDTVGPLCRSVGDARLLFDVIDGPDHRDPTSAPVAERPGGVGTERQSLEGVRIAVARELMTPNAAGIGEALDFTLGQLADAGAEINEVSIGDPTELTAIVFVILAVEAAAYHRPWIEERIDDYQPDVRAYLEMGLRLSGVDYVDAQRARRSAVERVAGVFGSHDLLFAPSQHTVAPRFDAAEVLFTDGSSAPRDLTLIRPLAPFNLTGNCAVAVPTGMIDGLPVGVQLVGPPMADHALLAYAESLHRLSGWRWQQPDLAQPETEQPRG